MFVTTIYSPTIKYMTVSKLEIFVSNKCQKWKCQKVYVVGVKSQTVYSYNH